MNEELWILGEEIFTQTASPKLQKIVEIYKSSEYEKELRKKDKEELIHDLKETIGIAIRNTILLELREKE